MFTYFRAISLFILLSVTVAWGAVSEIDGPGDIFGGGVTEGSDVGFANLTAHRIKANIGIFNNITVTTSIRGNNGSVEWFSSVAGLTTFRDSGGVTGIAIDPSPVKEQIRCLASECFVIVEGTNKSLTLSHLTNFTIADSFLDVRSQSAASSGEYINILNKPIINQSGTASYTAIYNNISTISTGSGQSYFYRASINNIEKYTFDIDGTLRSKGGIYTAFRNLSSATETLTSADHTVFCLANDNEVVATMPPCSGQLQSQQLMVIYTDSGSTNKCKLDGNGAETVASFDVFSGLDTFEEGCHFVCDGSGNWWRAGCF